MANGRGRKKQYREAIPEMIIMKHKLYVQRALREANGGELIVRHILERHGAVYFAGGSKMARAANDKLVEALTNRLDGGEKDAKRLLNKMKRKGLFSIEAWAS